LWNGPDATEVVIQWSKLGNGDLELSNENICRAYAVDRLFTPEQIHDILDFTKTLAA
jgi:hypothetical protein